jgi:hypothetical protein
MKNKRNYLFGLLATVFFTAACDDMLRDNLVILDAVTTFVYTIDTGDNNYSETETVNLQSIIDDIDGNVEDVSFYNITMRVSNIYDSSPETSFSGQLTARQTGTTQSQPLINFTDIKFEDFFTERSIFSDDIPGISVASGGISTLTNFYLQTPAPVVDFTVSGTINRAGGEDRVAFDFEVRLYTQIASDL